jgi:hypothetical protein
MKKTLALFLLMSGFIGLQGMCSDTGCCGSYGEENQYLGLPYKTLEQIKKNLEKQLAVSLEQENAACIAAAQARLQECNDVIAIARCEDK